MEWLVEVGLSNALAAAALALLAWIPGRIWRRPAVTHWLWVLVLLKLLTPPIFELPLPLSIARTAAFGPDVLSEPEPYAAAPLPDANGSRERAPNAPRALERDRLLAAEASIDGNHPVKSALEPPFSAATTSTLTVSAAGATASSNLERIPPKPAILREPTAWTFPSNAAFLARWREFVALVWLVGLIAWIVLQVALGLRLRAMLRASTPAPVGVSEAADQIARRMGLRRCPQVRIVAGTGSPMLCGLGRGATILMPAALLRRLGGEAQATVLAHELAHYWRGDQWVRLVEVVVTGLYWWHPVVWWARRQIEIAEEQCCDAHVIEMCAGKTRVYAEALLDVVDLISESARRMRPAMSSGIGHRPLLQERLVDVMKRRYVPTMTPVTRRVILVAGAVCLSCHPAVFVTEAPTVRAATTDASSEAPLRTLQALPELLNTLPAASPGAAEAPAFQLSQDFPSPARSEEEELAQEIEWATAISPNGRFHITVRRGYTCELREVTSDQVRSLAGHRITCVAFAADSARFVTGDRQGTVRLWDAASGELLQTLTERAGPVHTVCLAPSGEYVGVAGQDGVVELLSMTSRTDRQVLARLDAPVRCARFSPDGSRVGVVTDTWRDSSAGTVAVYDVATRARLLEWEVTGPIGAVDFPSEDRLVTIEWSGRVREWSLLGLYAQELPAIAKELVSAASFSVDSRVLEDLHNTDTL